MPNTNCGPNVGLNKFRIGIIVENLSTAMFGENVDLARIRAGAGYYLGR